MLCQTFLSDDIPRRSTEVLRPTGFGSARYSESILEPGIAEAIDRIDGMFFSPTGGSYPEHGTLVISGWTRQLWWPGWARWRWEFDAVTGAFLRWGSAIGGYYAREVQQGAGGELWLGYITGPYYLLNNDYRTAGSNWSLSSLKLTPNEFGTISFGLFFPDLARDRIVISHGSEAALRVYRYSTREQLAYLNLPDKPMAACYQDGARCYILTSQRHLFLIDYEKNCFEGAMRLGPGPSFWNAPPRLAYDPRYKRVLVLLPVPGNGSQYTTAIQGYRMAPIHTALCAPIPLDRQRAGQPFRVLIKAVGDRSEGLPGMVSLTHALNGPNAVPLDGRGEGIVVMQGATAGPAVITATMETPCLS